MDEKFMNLALQEAKKCLKNGDVPVGCVIVKGDKVIARGYNKRNKKKNSLMHAEIIAIDKACKHEKDWVLEDSTMYVTLEPCAMCAGAILQSRIKKLVIGTESEKSGSFGTVINMNEILDNEKFNHKVEIEKGILKDECSKILTNFFENLRMKNNNKN